VKRSEEALIDEIYDGLEDETKARVERAIELFCRIKREQGRICVLTGSGPNIHEGVTTLIAELIKKGLVDGVLTSSAVVAHEMAGSLEEVYRVDGATLGVDSSILPADGKFEISLCDPAILDDIEREIPVDRDLIERAMKLPGDRIIKAAGNMAYPLGLRTEVISHEVRLLAMSRGLSFEEVAGMGSDPMTMIGAGARKEVPVLVTVPQLVGGGYVGIEVSQSITMEQRSRRIADLLASADMIIESALALAQEVHDGPFETYSGHGIWSAWLGRRTFRMDQKEIVRIDLDPNLEAAWRKEKESALVAQAIAKGMPKTKLTGIPFRMEMSGFCRLPKSLPIVSDIGKIWPIIALNVSRELGTKLDFISFPQETEEGREMRRWIVRSVRPLDRKRMLAEAVP